jgi:hypothetical protein
VGSGERVVKRDLQNIPGITVIRRVDEEGAPEGLAMAKLRRGSLEPLTVMFQAVIVLNVASVLNVPVTAAPSSKVAFRLKSAAQVQVAANTASSPKHILDISNSPILRFGIGRTSTRPIIRHRISVYNSPGCIAPRTTQRDYAAHLVPEPIPAVAVKCRV